MNNTSEKDSKLINETQSEVNEQVVDKTQPEITMEEVPNDIESIDTLTYETNGGDDNLNNSNKPDPHKRSRISSICITSIVCAIALGSGIGLGIYFGAPYLEGPQDFGNVEEEDINVLYQRYLDNDKAIDDFKPYQLVNIAYKIFEDTPVHYTQVNDGWCEAPPVMQYIKSTYIRDHDKYFGEAVSASTLVQTGRRWYYSEGATTAVYKGKDISKDASNANWEKSPFQELDNQGMFDTWGRTLKDANIYIIANETVLEETQTMDMDGNININLKLDPTPAVKNYVRQMDNISGLDGRYPKFSKLEMEFKITPELELINRKVKEDYTVILFGSHPSISEMTEHYYVVDDIDIPTLNQNCEY